jgi:hypothetical protein
MPDFVVFSFVAEVVPFDPPDPQDRTVPHMQYCYSRYKILIWR